MRGLSMRSYAKLNLSLDLIGRRGDGYHELETVFTRISLCDFVSVKECKSPGIKVLSNLKYLPTGARNICHKAALAFFKSLGQAPPGLLIKLEKYIPVGAGLGGGSSNAAAVLLCLNKMYRSPKSLAELVEIAKPLGADLPFFFYGGTALGTGTGADITEAAPILPCYFVLVKPARSLSTAAVFSKVELEKDAGTHYTRSVLAALEAGDFDKLAGAMGNALERAAFCELAKLMEIKQSLLGSGAGAALMTGSGSCMFGIFKNYKSALYAFKKLKSIYGAPCVFIAKPH